MKLYFRWIAWNDYKGIAREDAQIKFMDLAIPILKTNGYLNKIRDPNKA